MAKIMESSLQKTFRHQGKIHCIFAVFVFIPLIHPTSIAVQSTIVAVAKGNIIRFIGSCKIPTSPKTVVKALETPDAVNESSYPFIPYFPTYIAFRSYTDLFHLYPRIPIEAEEFMGCPLSPPFIEIWKCW
jgi:hypothetical protein